MDDTATCKRCGMPGCSKNGLHRNKQRYQCPKCKFNFVEGDQRVKPHLALKKALARFISDNSLRGVSASSIEKYLGLSRSRDGEHINKIYPEYAFKPMEKDKIGFTSDEILAYINENPSVLGGQKRWIAAKGEIFPGYEALIIMRPTRKRPDKAPA